MKKYFKKSFSLMLAVLMVLSCWVWIAPTQAEAATAGNYYVEVTWKANRTGQSGTPSLDFNDSDDCIGFAIDYITNNGTGETKQQIYDLKGKTTGSDQVYTLTLSGFPVRLYAIVDHGSIFQTATLEVKKMRVGPSASTLTTIFDGVLSASSSTKFKSVSIDYLGKHYSQCTDGEADWDNTSVTVNEGTPVDRGNGTRGWDLPKPNSITGLSDTTNITIPDITNTTSVVSNTLTGVVKDQYSVNWYAAPKYNLAQAEGSSSSDMSDEESGFWWEENGDGATVKVNSTMQTIYNPTSTNDFTKDYYLVASLSENNGTAIASQKLHITWPAYDWYFDGTVQGSGDTKADIIMQDGSVWDDGNDTDNDNGIINAANYLAYNQKSTIYPVDAKKEGYTFYGFWTVKQPSVIGQPGDAFAYEASFTQPISSEEYELLSDEEKAKYYNAGTKWDPKADSSQLTTTGDKKYYAWWNSQDVTVKFYDVDGSFLGEKTVKYGHKNGAINPWPTPTERFSNGALSYSNWNGKWVNIDGEVVNSVSHTFTHDLILTPKYETVDFDYKYNITFNKTFGSFGAPYSGEYDYRATAQVPTDLNEIGALNAGDDYTYEFVGWSVATPVSGNYHIIQEDGDFDVNGNAVNLVSDFTVRSDATYYPVFRRYIRSYDVTFDYRDNTGEWKEVTKNFKYGEVITAPDGVPTEYATGGYGYTFRGWTKGDADVNLNTELCVPGLIYTAKYSEGVPTPYTVTFEYRNEAGELVSTSAQVNHGQNITQATVDSLEPAETYDNGEALVTYNGVWEYNGTRYNTEDLVSFSPENHVTFTAVYENPKTFYTVTYKDGANTKAFRITEGTALPFWTYEVAGEEGAEPTEETYLPSRQDTLDGSYTFTGWFDAEEGGNQYVPGETEITGNVTLYPQFSFGKFEYHIVFVNYDGTELAKGTFNYRDDVTALTNAAEAAAKRAADDTYSYQFIGWDKRVPATCEGGEPDSTLTFTAQYKPVYIYYDVEWFNDEASMNADAAGAPTELATSKYVYGDKMHTPSVTLTVPAGAPEGQNYVFAGWFYKDAAGVEHQFERNLTLTKDIMDENKVVKMYAKYALTAKTWNVTVVIDADTSYSFTVTDGSKITDLVSDPASGYVDETYHNAFSGWTTGEAGGTEFDVENATITADTTIYANFEVSEHEYTLSEVTTVPTYPMAELTDAEGNVLVEGSTGVGERTKWCACDTKRVNVQKESIPALTDSVAPTGTGYIGTQWKTGDEIKTVYANPKTDLIITTTDKGDVDEEFNATGKGIGVQKMEAIIVASDTTAADAEIPAFFENGGLEIYNWTQIQAALIEYYETWDNVPAMYKDYNANVTLKAGNYGLTDGTTYCAYIKITDKAGNVSYLGSAPFVYDATAPAVELDGDSNYNGEKFCEEIEVVVTEDNAYTVTANGVEVVADEETGKYVISGKGYYNIVVEDAAGNKVNKYAEIMGGHDKAPYTQEATCFDDGLTSNRCTVCGKDFDKVVITSPGHVWEYNTVAATCTEHGYIEATCKNCNNTAERQYYKTNDDGSIVTDEDGNDVLLAPATGHTYDKDLDGVADEGATGVVAKAATCHKTGTINYTCGTCGATLTAEIPVDADAHNFYTPVIVKPTCTQAGYATQTCRYCGTIVTSAQGSDAAADNYDASLAPTGHDAGAYVVTKQATCKEDGVETLKCTVCNATIQKENEDGELVDVTKTISKDTVAHTWVATKTVEPTETDKGYTVYKCSVCGKEQNGDYVDILTKYTVIIYNEAGEELHNAKYTAGNTLPADVAADQTKANSADGKTKYTFAGWYTKKDNGDWGSEVKLGSAVNSDLKLYPKFTESAIFYTLQFKVPTKYDGTSFTDYEVVKELMGAIGDSRVPAAAPTMAEDDYYTYEFQGWTKAGAEFDDNASIVVAGDATYEAVFKPVAKTFDVIFMNEGIALGKVSVVAGADAEYKGEDPAKAPDADNHYKWTGWDGSLKNIMAKTTVKATYETIAHTWEVVKVSQQADCVLPELTDYECAGCEATKTEQTAPAEGHVEGEPVLDEKTGEYVVSCTVCDEEIRRTDATFTITFVNENGSGLGTIYVDINGEVAYAGSTPTKAQTSEYRYTFAGWEAEDGTKYAVGTALPVATKDAEYKAYYTSEKRTYRVSYADSANNVLYTVAEVAYGAAVPEYKGATATSDIAVPAYTNDVHYVFDKWDVNTTTVTGNLLIRPKFKAVDHTVVKEGETTATCTQPGGIKWSCADECGYEYIDGNVPVLAHNWVLDELNSYEPDYNAMTPGLHVYKCSYGCGNTKEEVVPVTTRVINITVKDQNGNAIEGAQVDLYKDGEWVDIQYSSADGKVTFYVKDEGTYTVIVSGIDDADNLQYDITVGANGYDDNGNAPTVNVIDCSCACHRDGFWGSIFRFFHKIIKFFTGEFNCCDCPDERYN